MARKPNPLSFHEGDYPDGVSSRFVGINSRSVKQFLTGAHMCQGLYWTAIGETPAVAFMAIHYNTDFSEHYLAPLMAKRGYGFLGWNSRFRGNEDKFILEEALDDIAAGVEWLRKEGGAKKIVFIGNSGGGSLMLAYQATAQKQPTWVTADAFIFLNAHPGRPDAITRWLDPSVIDETDPTKTDPSLDMYNPANKPPFTEEFIKRYRAAQVERNHRITNWVKGELKRVNDGGIPDRIFPLYRTMADLRFTDGTIDPSDRPVPSCYSGDPETANRSASLLGRTNTLRTWLSMWSLQDSQCKIEPYASVLTVPTFVLQSLADTGVFPSDAQHIYDILNVKDKELKLIKGDHFFLDIHEREAAADVIEEWTRRKV